MTHSSRGKYRRTWADEIIVLIIAVALGTLLWQAAPVPDDVHYRFGNMEEERGELPLSFDAKDVDEELEISFMLWRSPILSPMRFVLRGDDCVTAMIINGQSVPSAQLAPCIIDVPRTIDLQNMLHKGDNHISVHIRDTGGRMGFAFKVSPRDPVMLTLRLSLLVFLMILGCLLATRCTSRTARIMLLIVVAGIILRLIYADVTPFNTRGNDDDGHREYIEFLLEHRSIPQAHEGWQFYQPPLYYAIAALPYGIVRAASGNSALALKSVQALSILISVGVLLLSWSIATLLFTGKRSGGSRILFILIMALAPGMIILSPKVNNDALVHLLIVAGITLLLWTWRTPTLVRWCATVIVLSFGILTKMNALPMLLAALGCMILHPTLTRRERITWCALGITLALCMTEWLLILRMMEDDPVRQLVGNAGSLHSGLRLSNTAASWLTFRPNEILHMPFNNAWGHTMGRGMFWEYFFRSAFFGEFSFDKLRLIARALLFCGVLALPLSLAGLLALLRHSWRTAGPMAAILCCTLGAHIVFRARYPFSPSQDFRYSPQLLLPIAAGFGALWMHASWHARVMLAIAAGIGGILSCAFFIGVWIAETST